METAAVIVGAGRGQRLGGPLRKAWTELAGRPLWWHAARSFRASGVVSQLVLVVHEEDLAAASEGQGAAWCKEVGVDALVVGGADRQASVAFGVKATRPECDLILVHDAARPFVEPARIRAAVERLEAQPAVLLAMLSPATVKRVDASEVVTATLDRSELRLATTPQGGRRERLIELLDRADEQGQRFTDEAALFEWGGDRVSVIEDSPLNFKVTTPADLQLARALVASEPPRIGHGYDIHRIAPGGPLVLGGIEIPVEFHLDGHSDGDAVIHAIIEAFLGAAGLPDIGEHFPPTDPTLKGVDSKLLLERVLADLLERDLIPLQVDVNIIAEKPRLGPHKSVMKAKLQSLLSLPTDRLAVKARSGEKVGPIGRGEAIEVHCSAMLIRSAPRPLA